ncbi:FAD-binding oxidoreductase [uncultured Lutibacter sp.]|uniref:NAD(P)/FAD-dependent oxidoreductase n=1 Tax=uncultured Lutibacter sp. TaxID=437739 RepID=UPI0026342AA9|nr:FAD-binding oxidoreductase [uncultured Lutibacter sp.]
MKIDYIIVGLGLAGLSFSRELEKNGKSYIVYEDNSQNSSIVAGGMYNPVILKRFTPVWNAIEQLNLALPFYKDLEKKFNKKYDYSVDIYRIFKTIEEQNNWFIASDKPRLSNYMVSEILHEKYEGIQSNFGFGKLINTGRIDTKSLINDYRNYLLTMGLLKNESFNYEKLKLDQSNCTYEEFQATKVVFCEGFGLSTNPFFNYLPMKEAKGELLVIHAPKLKVDFLIKAAVFVMPLGNNYYKVGATFNWKDKSKNPTQEGKNELISKLESFLTVPYKIVEHVAGIRPTIKDRRPLLGKHPKHNNLAVFNGLGTRGVMIAPLAAKTLYNHLEKGVELDNDFTINRF